MVTSLTMLKRRHINFEPATYAVANNILQTFPDIQNQET